MKEKQNCVCKISAGNNRRCRIDAAIVIAVKFSLTVHLPSFTGCASVMVMVCYAVTDA